MPDGADRSAWKIAGFASPKSRVQIPLGPLGDYANRLSTPAALSSSLASTDLLQDEDVRRWYENLCGGSVQTARERLRVLARLCRHLETTPQKIVLQVEEDGKALEDRLHDFLRGEREAGRTASYLENYLKALRSWLDHYGLKLKRKFKLGNMRQTSTVMEEQVPTAEQLRDLLLAATPRGRVVISLIAFSGLRPGVLGNFEGTDGLRVRDLPDFTEEAGVVAFSRSPAVVRVRTELSKVAHPYLTLLGQEGMEHLRRYLQIRVDGGEALRPESPVVRCAPGFETMGKREGARNHGSAFIVTGNVTGDVRRAMDKVRWQARPYVLRRYFETQLFNASWKGLVPRDWITFWAGHKGDIEHIYVLHKGLPPGLIEDMREAYAKAEPLLFASTASLRKEEGREIAAVDVSTEEYSLTVKAEKEKWARKTDEEKMLAFMVKAVQENDVLKAAMREALRE